MRFEERLLERWPLKCWRDRRVLLAVSGGADSIAMLHACARIADEPGRLEVAHFNHQWRGPASDADEKFVAETAARLGLSLHLGRAADFGGDLLSQSEQTARSLRYQFLTQTAYRTGASYVLTAHTASDQVETILHNLFRGTGIAGLRAIEFCRPLDEELVLVRPLLDHTRQDVQEYLRAIDEDYREDASNEDRTFKRNFIRHELLPLLREKFNDKLDGRLLQLSNRLSEIEELLKRQAETYFEHAEKLLGKSHPTEFDATPQSQDLTFPTNSQLQGDWVVLHAGLCRRWHARDWPLMDMSQQKWKLIEECWLGNPKSPRLGWRTVGNLPGGLVLRASQAWVTISPAKPANR